MASIACGHEDPETTGTQASKTGASQSVDKILIISVDCLRSDHLSAYGYDRKTSPAIDSLAADGVRFDRAYAQSNWTKPSIASLFSGLYVRNHGVTVGTDLLRPDGSLSRGIESYPLPTNIHVVAETFREAGFRTAGFVENSHLVPSQGFGRGFEVYERQKPAAVRIRQWIEERDPSERIFAFIHLIGPHDPYDHDKRAYDAYRGRFPDYGSEIDFKVLNYKKRKDLKPKDIDQATSFYDLEVAYYDGDHIAPLLGWLRDSGLYDDFLIVLTADHGEELFDHGDWAHGHSLYEEVTRVPLIFKLPTHFGRQRPTGSVLDENVELIDLYPTLAELAGIDMPTVDGESFAPLLSGTRDSNPQSFAITEYARAVPGQILAAAIVQGNDKLILRYDVAHAPKLLGLKGAKYHQLSTIDGFGEIERKATTAPEIADMERLRGLMIETLGEGSSVSAKPSETISLDAEDIERLRALGYLDGAD